MSNTKRFAVVLTILAVLVTGFFTVPNKASAAAVCSPATAVNVPYAKDGAGDICVVANSLCSYVNSWNLATLEINGTSYLNLYTAASSIAPLNGGYTIHYVSNVSWGHFEIGGTCGSSPTATTAPATATTIVGPTATPTKTSIPVSTATKTNTPAITSTVTPVSGVTTSINVGGTATGSFTADQYYSGGTTYSATATIDMSQITSNPPPAAIFNTERYGAMTYTIPNRAAGSAQTVKLYFVESYATAAGQRLFNVTINGTTVLSSFDIYASAGGQNKAIARTFNTTANSNGQVVIQFINGTQNAKVNGIAVTGAITSNPTPTATSTGSSTNPSAGCGKTRTLQNGTISIQSNGTRQYILRVPDNYSNTRAYRFVVAYHWLNGSAQEVANGNSWASETPYYGLWNLANNSTIFVAPVGLNAGWANTNGQDVTFTDAILAQVKSELCIDQSRIFATGFSYGAGMSYAIACARPTVFRGVALYAGAQLSGCSGGNTPIAYFATHGLSDSVLNISGGRTLRNRFVTLNGVTAQNPPEPAVGSGTHICTKYAGGSPSYPVTWCAFDGDHNPNPHDRNQSTSWVPQQVWNFLIQF